MNTSLILVLLLILIFGLVLFWLFYRKSNTVQLLSEKYLLDNLAGNNLTSQQRTEQEQQLSQLLQKKHQPQPVKILILIAIIIIPSSGLLYKHMGNPDAINYKANSSQVSNNGQIPETKMSMQEAVKQLEEKLSQNPNDIDGQMLFARSQVSMKAFDKAVKAYRKANELAPNEPVILTELAEAIALFNNNRSFLGEPEKLLAQAVNIDDTNQKALWLYGMTFYEKQDFAKTNELWSKLYDLMTDEKAKNQLLEQLTDVRSKLGLESNTSKNKQPESFQLNVNISYDTKNLPPQKIKRATLYLYTKATTGMPMPIAVIQKPLEVISNAFPMTLTLNDLNNLQPSRKLSDFDSIIIGARISYTGNAMAQAGDLQSQEITLDLPYSDTVELIINEIKQ